MEAKAFWLPPLVPRISGTGCSLWGTPRNSDGMKGQIRSAESVRRLMDKQGRSNPQRLEDQITLIYPTPSASDHKGSCSVGQRRGQLSEAIEPSANASNGDSTPRATLNPAWVEWLMGFPPGWTDCEG
jgi:hypothetical protein